MKKALEAFLVISLLSGFSYSVFAADGGSTRGGGVGRRMGIALPDTGSDADTWQEVTNIDVGDFSAGGGSSRGGGVGRRVTVYEVPEDQVTENPYYVYPGLPSVSGQGGVGWPAEHYYSCLGTRSLVCVDYNGTAVTSSSTYGDIVFNCGNDISQMVWSAASSGKVYFYYFYYLLTAPVSGYYTLTGTPVVTASFRNTTGGTIPAEIIFGSGNPVDLGFTVYLAAGETRSYHVRISPSSFAVTADLVAKGTFTFDIEDAGTSTTNITHTTNITINNVTYNGDIYIDNSTNNVYIYENNIYNETVIQPIIYNVSQNISIDNSVNNYAEIGLTYDPVTNNYYVVQYPDNYISDTIIISNPNNSDYGLDDWAYRLNGTFVDAEAKNVTISAGDVTVPFKGEEVSNNMVGRMRLSAGTYNVSLSSYYDYRPFVWDDSANCFEPLPGFGSWGHGLTSFTLSDDKVVYMLFKRVDDADFIPDAISLSLYSDGAATPTPTPGGGTPTPTPGDGGDPTPTPTPGDGGSSTPTPTPGATDTPTTSNPFGDIVSTLFDGAFDLIGDMIGAVVGFLWGLLSGFLGIITWAIDQLLLLVPFLPPAGVYALAAGIVAVFVLTLLKFVFGLFF